MPPSGEAIAARQEAVGRMLREVLAANGVQKALRASVLQRSLLARRVGHNIGGTHCSVRNGTV